jgi:DNA-binding transcriptional LysR family regulator
MTAERYAAGGHILVSRLRPQRTAVDAALEAGGGQRRIVTIVGGFAAALALARATDLIATVPERHSGPMREGMHSFALPLALPDFTVSLIWHPRLHADPAHRWLRSCVREVCGDLPVAYS